MGASTRTWPAGTVCAACLLVSASSALTVSTALSPASIRPATSVGTAACAPGAWRSSAVRSSTSPPSSGAPRRAPSPRVKVRNFMVVVQRIGENEVGSSRRFDIEAIIGRTRSR